MHNILRSVRVFAGFAVLSVLAGCGGSTPAAPSITVTIAPATGTAAAMIGGATQNFTATVANDSANAGVTWAISSGGGSLSATSALSGVAITYTAASPVTGTSAVLIATSKTNVSISASVSITLTPISVSAVSPATVTLNGGGTQQFAATVTADSSNSGVTWSVSPSTGAGTISSGGLYTAPAVVTVLSASITATSVKDPTKTSATAATVTLTPISVGAISPVITNLGVSQTQAFTAAVANDSSNSGVSWSITSGPGTLTSSSTTGVTYNAPTTAISATTPVTVQATSIKDPTKYFAQTFFLQPIAVAAVTPSAVSLAGGATQQFAGAAVTYDGTNSGVTWSVSPSSGAGTISSSGLYTAPAVVGSATSATITATSVKDPTKSGTTAIVTLLPISVSFGSTTSATLDASQQYQGEVATISNDASNSGILFTVATGGGDIGSSSTTSTTVTSSPYSPIYYAPTTVPSTTTTTITATSVKDPTKSATFTVTLNPAMAFTTPSSQIATLTAATTNTAYSYTLATSGGTGTKTYTVFSGAFPTGLTLSSSGVISGTVTGAAGSYVATVRVTDQSSNPSVLSGTFTIVVSVAPLVFNTPTLPTGTVGTAYSQQLTATGGTGALSYSINTGGLPTGMALLSTGLLSGTPTQPTVVAGTPLTFKVTDSATPTPATQTTGSVNLIVNPVLLVVSLPTLPTGYVGTAYNTSGYQFTSTGGTGTITWTMSPTTVDGLSLSTTGLLTGTPTATYSSTISVTATDSATNQQQVKTITPSLTVSNALTVTTIQGSLPLAYVGTAYNTTGYQLAAAGGSGTGYTWAVTSGATGTNSLASLNLSVSSAGLITGTPSASGTATFTVQVTDSLSHTNTATFTITAYAPLSLPTPPGTLSGATVSQTYSGTIVASGGVGPTYTFTVNSVALANNSSLVSIGDGLSVSSNGNGTLNVSGTPTSATTVSFTVKVTDSASNSTGTNTYSIVAGTNYSISGSVNLNYCGGSLTMPATTITLKQGSTTIATATTSNGSYTLTNIPNGSYTITPSITGPSSVFYPASYSVTVSGSNLTSYNYSASLGYTVTGTVAYGGAKTGRIYVELTNNSCSSNGGPGTSISAAGAYTIHGVPPGAYTLTAFMDPSTLGQGHQNAVDPTGSSSVTVSTSNFTGANVTMADPGTVSLGTSSPSINAVSPFSGGVFIFFNALTNSNNIETPVSYTVQWSTSSTFATITGSQTFTANGTNGANVWVVNGLTNGTAYYFRAYGTSGGGNGGYGVYGSPTAVTINTPSTGSTVTGTVTFTGVTPTGPLYVGAYTGTGVYVTKIASPTAAGTAYTLQVPNGTYEFFSVLDQNNDGIIDTGDITNVNVNNLASTTISGNTSNVNVTLPTSNSVVTLTTQHNRPAGTTGSSDGYNIQFRLSSGVKLPVTVEAISATNPDILIPQDIGITLDSGASFNPNISLYNTAPVVGDSYGLLVTYSDGTSETLNPSVSAVLSAFATALSPTGNTTNLTPTFTWTYPASASSYTYGFNLNPSSGNTIWQIPGNNSNSNGFTNSVTSIVWGTDPTGGGSTPSVSSLTSGATYNWQLTTMDSNSNQATVQATFVP